jgi:hypothetical protein
MGGGLTPAPGDVQVPFVMTHITPACCPTGAAVATG